MRSKVNVDIGKYIMEGMMTILIILIFLLIAQNWVLTNTDDTPLTATCNLSEIRVEIGEPVPYEIDKIIDSYKLCKIRFDNM